MKTFDPFDRFAGESSKKEASHSSSGAPGANWRSVCFREHMIDDLALSENTTEEDTSANDVHPTNTVQQADHLKRCKQHFDMVKERCWLLTKVEQDHSLTGGLVQCPLLIAIAVRTVCHEIPPSS
eukprot:scaffold30483_cov52-Attheya_sp.AAC.6